MPSNRTTIRLLMPQWQGGNNELYTFGARLLTWLAPPSDDPTIEVPIAPFTSDDSPQQGISHRSALLDQARTSRRLIDGAKPDKIVIFGGDCLVEQSPFAYLNERYNGELGVLWIDSHPDIKTTDDWTNAHTMVLGNLLGEGDSEFASEVRVPLRPKNVMYAGLRELGLTEQEAEVIDRLDLGVAPPESLVDNSKPVLDWLADRNIKHLAIHLDVDVLDPTSFRSVLFAEPEPEIDWREMYPVGKMTLGQVTRLISDAAEHTDVVGLGICEHLPWDAARLRDALSGFPLLSSASVASP